MYLLVNTKKLPIKHSSLVLGFWVLGFGSESLPLILLVAGCLN